MVLNCQMNYEQGISSGEIQVNIDNYISTHSSVPSHKDQLKALIASSTEMTLMPIFGSNISSITFANAECCSTGKSKTFSLIT